LRWGKDVWGQGKARQRTSEANWKLPLRWNKQAAEKDLRLKVFCASMADVFDPEVPPAWRADLFKLITATPHLDWLQLTKRPENAIDMMGGSALPSNVWLGTPVEDLADRCLVPLQPGRWRKPF
jgi:protein gp37